MGSQKSNFYADADIAPESKIENNGGNPKIPETQESPNRKPREQTEHEAALKQETVRDTSGLKRRIELGNIEEARDFSSIDVMKLPETNEEKEQFAYFKNAAAAVIILLLARGLKPEQIKNFSDVANIDANKFNLRPVEKSILEKLREIARAKDSPLYAGISKNWQEFIKQCVNASRQAISAAQSVQQEVKGEKPKKENKLYKYITENPGKSLLIGAGLAAGAYYIYRWFKGKKNEKHSGGGNNEEDTIDKIWKWTKRALFIGAGVFVVGRLLDLETVKDFFHKKLGIDITDSRFAQFLVFLSHGKILEAFETLGKGVENSEVFNKAKENIKAETSVEVRADVLKGVSTMKYGQFMNFFNDIFDKAGMAVQGALPEGIQDLFKKIGIEDKQQISAIREFLKKHEPELRQKGLTDDITVGKAFELLGYGTYEPPKKEPEKPEDKSGKDAILKNAPVIFARTTMQWPAVIEHYRKLPPSSKAMVDASFKRYKEVYGWVINEPYEKARMRQGEIEAALEQLKKEAESGKLTEAQRVANLAEQELHQAHLNSLRSRRAFEAFRKEFGSYRTFGDIEKALKDFEIARAANEKDLRARPRLSADRARQFERLADELTDIKRSAEAAASKEIREIIELSKTGGKEAEIAKRLERVAKIEAEVTEATNRFLVRGGNADLLRELLADTQDGGWRKTIASRLSRNSVDLLEDMRPSGRVKSIFKFKFSGGKLMLIGVGAAGILSFYQSRKVEWGIMGKAAAGFVPVLAEYIDMKDAIKAFSIGDIKEGALNTAFFIGDLASDILLFVGIGVGGKGVMSSLKTVKGLRSMGKIAEGVENGVKYRKVISIEEKCAYRIYENGKVVRTALEEADLARAEGLLAKAGGIIGRMKKTSFAHQAFLQKCMKGGFATGAALALTTAAVPIAEWAFGKKESAPTQTQENAGAQVEQTTKQAA